MDDLIAHATVEVALAKEQTREREAVMAEVAKAVVATAAVGRVVERAAAMMVAVAMAEGEMAVAMAAVGMEVEATATAMAAAMAVAVVTAAAAPVVAAMEVGSGEAAPWRQGW